MKNLTKIADLSIADVEALLSSAFSFKEKSSKGIRRESVLDGHPLAMVFEKPSLRTKVSFEVAISYLGGIPIYLSSSQILASGQNEQGRESIPDITKNLERFCDMIIARVYSHSTIESIASCSRVPVINALCDCHHPCQALADLMAIRLHKGTRKVKVAFIGDGNNVATSLMQICALSGLDFVIASPDDHQISEEEKKQALAFAEESKSSLEFLKDPKKAVENVDVVYTDTFVSMGDEDEKEERMEAFKDYQVNRQLFNKAKNDAVFMHCLPAHRGEEVSDDIMDSPSSIVFDQAECRLHIAKALIQKLMQTDRKDS